MATPNYDINYDDKKFTQVESEKQQALTEVEQTYGGMIDQSDSYYQSQIDASKEWAEKQQQMQQEQTDFAIEQIEQEKQKAEKDYTKEQSGAYTDWQKQSNAYGVNAEQMASSGLSNTGFSESSQVSMYNQYQNRVAVARESYNQIVMNYNNNIKEAQLQNNSKLAEIAYTALRTQLELSLQGFQYKNQLLETQLAQKQATEDRYYARYQDVLAQMNQENALAEEVRQYNENLALQKEQMQEEIRQYEQNYALQKQQLQEEIRQFNQSYALQEKQYEEGIRQFDEEIARLKEQDKKENEYKIKQFELQKEQLEQEKAQWEKEFALKMEQYKESQRQFDKTYKASQESAKIDKESTSTPTFSTYGEASAYLKKQGVATGDGGLMTRSEWFNRRRSGSKSPEFLYASYDEYLNNFVAWRLKNPM